MSSRTRASQLWDAELGVKRSRRRLRSTSKRRRAPGASSRVEEEREEPGRVDDPFVCCFAPGDDADETREAAAPEKVKLVDARLCVADDGGGDPESLGALALKMARLEAALDAQRTHYAARLQAQSEELKDLRQRVAELVDDDAAEEGPAPVEAHHHDASGEMDPPEALEESIWNVAYVAFADGVEPGTSWLLVLLFFFNAFLQTFFLYIVMINMLGSEVTDTTIKDLQRWREGAAHEVWNYDFVTKKSLARRVCDDDAALEVSARQADYFASFAAYAGKASDASFTAPGPSMCLVALVVWTLTVAGETNQIFAAIRQLWYTRVTEKTEICTERDDELDVVSLSRPRAAAAWAALAMRCYVCASLAGYGSQFLAVTIDLGDLVLNTVALEFVLGVDELIFAALVPLSARRYVRAHQGRATPKMKAWMGVEFQTICTVGGCVGLVSFFLAAVVVPQTYRIVEARDALCAGDRDFVLSTDGFGTPVWSYPDWIKTEGDGNFHDRNYPNGGGVPGQPEFNTGSNYGSYFGATLASLLRQHGRVPREDCCYDADHCGDDACYVSGDDVKTYVMRDDAPGCCLVQKTFTSDTTGTTFSVMAKSSWSVATANKLWNPQCYDILDLDLSYSLLIAAAVGDSLDATSCGGCPPDAPFCAAGECIVPGCADVAQYCHDNTVTGRRARQVCPNTCGCNDPKAPLALWLSEEGCGDQCVRSGVYRQKLGELPCEDVEKDDPNFAAFLDDISAVASTLPMDWEQASQNFVSMFRAAGCAALDGTTDYTPYFLGHNPCAEDGWWFPSKPLSYFCPVACACRAGDPHCPTTCPARHATAPDCPAYQRELANSYPNSTTCALTLA